MAKQWISLREKSMSAQISFSRQANFLCMTELEFREEFKKLFAGTRKPLAGGVFLPEFEEKAYNAGEILPNRQQKIENVTSDG